MELPLFPLQVVLFPGRPLPLHVFEPRYRQMLADCLEGDRRFGVVAIRSGSEIGDGAVTFDVGTVAVIEDVQRLPDGRAELLTRGSQRFRILDRLAGMPYQRARVELIDDVPPAPSCGELAGRLRDLLHPYLRLLGAPDELLARLPRDPLDLAHLAIAAAHAELPEQQRLLELDEPAARLGAAFTLLRREACLMRHLGAFGSLRPAGPGGAELN